MLIRSRLGLLHIIFHASVIELWPLIDVSPQYLDFTKFCISIDIDKIYVGIVTCIFWHIYTRVMALDLRQNFFSAQYMYLENKLTEFTKFCN